MHIHLMMLITDWLVYALVVLVIIFFIFIRRLPAMRESLGRVLHHRIGMIAATVLSMYVFIGLIDSIHFEVTYPKQDYKVPQMLSLLDFAFTAILAEEEKSYSAPFALHAYNKSIIFHNGKEQHGFSRLHYGGKHISHTAERNLDILKKILIGIRNALCILILLYGIFFWLIARRMRESYWLCVKKIGYGQTAVCWREIFSTLAVLLLILLPLFELIPWYHVMGTDKVGHDVFYISIKSIRTGLLIGTLTTLFMLPFALILGMMAGFFSGWIDDVIQYLYTTVSSIPGVLLISATILVMQLYIARHAELFTTLMQRADARLLALCIILGVTSWASLCRLLRAETLKLRELEFIQAATALGVGNIRILFRHIMPNLMHIVLITIVLDFSMLVLAEAVLSYVGVGVDPTTFSWGNMINSSRLELAREPLVWWPLVSALIFMFILVLSANLLADALRDALDPRIRTEIM